MLKSLWPGESSAPEAMSRAAGWTAWRASAALVGFRPPARMTGVVGFCLMKLEARDQSKVSPVPP